MRQHSVHVTIASALALLAGACLASASTGAATVVALGASNTYGKGVARNQAYINGDTTKAC
jgi:acyl-CoA thioesterase I